MIDVQSRCLTVEVFSSMLATGYYLWRNVVNVSHITVVLYGLSLLIDVYYALASIKLASD